MFKSDLFIYIQVQLTIFRRTILIKNESSLGNKVDVVTGRQFFTRETMRSCDILL